MGQTPSQTCTQPNPTARNDELLIDSLQSRDFPDCEAGGVSLSPILDNSSTIVASGDDNLVDGSARSEGKARESNNLVDGSARSEGKAKESKEIVALGGSYLPPCELQRLVGDEVCAICLDPLHGRAQTIALCGHIFHRACLNRCRSGRCPQCRLPIDAGPVQTEGEYQASPGPSSRFSAGTLVVIHGLQNHIELNGTRGHVVHYHETVRRYEVRATPSGQFFGVKAENLVAFADDPPSGRLGGGSYAFTMGLLSSTTPLNLEPGTVVRLSGLLAARTYNGQLAEIVSTDRARGRYEIKLEDGSVKTIAAEKVEFVSTLTSNEMIESRIQTEVHRVPVTSMRRRQK